jgi:hypothetical protein
MKIASAFLYEDANLTDGTLVDVGITSVSAPRGRTRPRSTLGGSLGRVGGPGDSHQSSLPRSPVHRGASGATMNCSTPVIQRWVRSHASSGRILTRGRGPSSPHGRRSSPQICSRGSTNASPIRTATAPAANGPNPVSTYSPGRFGAGTAARRCTETPQRASRITHVPQPELTTPRHRSPGTHLATWSAKNGSLLSLRRSRRIPPALVGPWVDRRSAWDPLAQHLHQGRRPERSRRRT